MAEILTAHLGATAFVLARGPVTNLLDPGSGILMNMLRRAQSGIIFKFHDRSLPQFARHLVAHERALLITMGVGVAWLSGSPCPTG